MTGSLIFEHRHRGHIWRLEVQSFRGRTFGNLRKWYAEGDCWKPTRDGFTMPLEALASLTAALMEHHGLEPPETLESGS
ncbi:MAG: transcriptional coactivator p15/PC4 family protein [Novosphingobium sp.]